MKTDYHDAPLTYAEIRNLTPDQLRELVRRLPTNASQIWEVRKQQLAEIRKQQIAEGK